MKCGNCGHKCHRNPFNAEMVHNRNEDGGKGDLLHRIVCFCGCGKPEPTSDFGGTRHE